MCGLAGSYGQKIFSSHVKNRILKILEHRGPDGSGYVDLIINRRNLFLAHTRLAIIDLNEHALQPFIRDSMALVFNGEIYNYLEIKKVLISLGHTFLTNSDTEVVLVAYKQWREECVNYFEGMWSLALVDEDAGTLWLSRDRFGEKPLYYHVDDLGNLFFASEFRALISMLDEVPRVNSQKIFGYLVNGFRAIYHNNDTWFNGIKEFPRASSALIRDPKNIQINQYWTLKYDPQKISLDDAEDELREKALRAIKIRMRSDVPIAFCLSGGIDSGFILGVATQILGRNISTFSIVDRDARYDESENINSTSSYLGVSNHKVHLDQNKFFDRMKNLIDTRGAPISTISYYAHSFITEKMADFGFKIGVSGVGADELFAGYYDHYNFWLAEQVNASNFGVLIDDWKMSFGKHVQNRVLREPLCFLENPKLREHLTLDSEIFRSLVSCKESIGFNEEKYCEESILRNRMLNDLFLDVVPVILFEDDANSMMYGIENRSPFLDRELAEFAYKIPNKYLIHNGLSKNLLRSISRGYIPDSVRLDKRKKGFNASIKTLLDCSKHEILEWLMEPSEVFNYINREKFFQFLKNDMNLNSFSKFLFSFVSVKIFLNSLKYNFPHGEN